MTRVFVYGTLMRGQSNHRMLQRARYIGKARTAGEFTMITLGPFPGVVDVPDVPIAGEVYEVTDAELAVLDALESEGRFYHRVGVELDDGTRAEMYILPAHYRGRTRIESGDWDAHLNNVLGGV